MRVWHEDACLCILRGHTVVVACLAVLSDSFLVSAGEDGMLKWWKSTSSSCLHTVNGIAADVMCVLPSSSPESESLLTVQAAADALIVVVDGVDAGGNQLPARLSCLALMPDG